MNKTTKTLLWTLGITIAVILLYYWAFYEGEDGGTLGEVEQTIDDTLNAIVRGSKVTNSPYDKSTGLVPGNPDDLASSAGFDTETYTLGRAIASEEELSSNATKVAVGWVYKNYADSTGQTLTALMTKSTYHGNDSYGTQKNIDQSSDGYQSSDRYASTANDPYQGDMQIAQGILNGTYPDPTGGAIQEDRPAGENAAKVQAKRTAAGETVSTLPNVPGVEFWSKL